MSTRPRILVVGVGSIGERHVRCFGATGRVDLAVCEANPALRQTIAGRYRIERAFASLEEALRDRPTGVAICTPAHLHLPMALVAAQAGAHLFIEKPLSTTLDGLDAVRAEVARRSLVATAAYVYRALPVLGAMRSALLSGRFGAPVQIVAVSGQHFPFYRPAYREIYYKDRATGGGAVQDALTHVVNAGEWLVGPVTRLVADCAHQVLEGVTVEDTVHVVTRHGAVLGSFSLNQHQPVNETTITVLCHRGAVRCETHENRWRWAAEPGGAWHDEPGAPIERDAWFTRQADAFLDAIEGKCAPLCTLDEAAQTLRVNLAILASAERGAWETIHE
jgi:predicted dehydrogenase